MAEVRAKLAPGTPIEVWFQDEMRVGQKNKLTYRWAKKGSRPQAAHAGSRRHGGVQKNFADGVAEVRAK